MEYWHWWALAVVLVAIEVVAPSTILVWPAVAAALLGVLLAVVPDVDWRHQLLLFAVVSVLASLFWYRRSRRRPARTDRPLLNRRGQRYVGRRIRLDEALGGGRGRTRIDDTWWPVESEDGGDLLAGREVEITGVSGTALRVRATAGGEGGEPGGGTGGGAAEDAAPPCS